MLNHFFRRYKRSNYRYYHISRKRWHRAVASHSIPGKHNPRARSRFIPNELTLDHIERKSLRLPCGKTVAQSWAALRKAWLGFKIARSNGHTNLMSYYASFITKVQREMGIEVTNFDSHIFEEELDEVADNCFYKKQVKSEVMIKEDDLNYDSMMNDAYEKTNRENYPMSTPRENIFDRSETYSSYLPPEKNKKLRPKIVSRIRHISQYRWYNLPAKASKLEVEDPNYYLNPGSGAAGEGEEEEDPNYYLNPGSGAAGEGEEEEERSGRRSSFYKRKR